MHLLLATQGLPGYVKYLKVATVVTQQCIAGQRLNDLTPLGPRISRSKRGFPRILPPFVRKMMSNGEHKYVQWTLTMFSVFRLAVYDASPKTSTITSPRIGSLAGERYISRLLPKVLKAFVGPIKDLSPPKVSLWLSSSPNSDRKRGEYSSHPWSIIKSAYAFGSFPKVRASLLYLINLHPRSQVSYLWKRAWSMTTFLRHMGNIDSTSNLSGILTSDRLTSIGKIGQKQEAAGKVRIFAMVDPFTQWVLKPLHSAIFRILKNHRMDGTFDQLKPLSRLKPGVPTYSLDLTAATDRLPISLQEKIIGYLYGKTFSLHWRNVLIGRSYIIKDGPTKDRLYYAVGQPMGALSSWGMLALTHHVIVQCAAILANRPIIFRDYGLLGDDIVIWDKGVALKYLKIMASIGLEINISKSIVSPHGEGLEFAKKTFFKGKDVSPITLSEVFEAIKTSAGLVGLVRKYDIPDPVVKSLLGLGYKSSIKTNRWLLYLIAKNIPLSGSDFKSLLIKVKSTTQTRDEFKQEYSILYEILSEMIDNLMKNIDNQLSELQNTYVWYNGSKDPPLPNEKGNKSYLSSLSEGFSFTQVEFHFDLNVDVMTLERNQRAELVSNATSQLSLLRDRLIITRREFQDKLLLRGAHGSLYFEPGFLNDNYLKNLTSMESLAKSYFDIDEEVAALQVQQILAPSFLESTSPRAKETRRLADLWNRWSRTILTRNDTILQSAFPLEMLLTVLQQVPRAATRMMRWISPSTGARALLLSQQGLRAGGRITSDFFLSWKNWLLILRFVLVTNIFVTVVFFSGVVAIIGLRSILVNAGGSSLLTYFPSFDTFESIVKWILCMSIGWTALVSLNHWNDLVVMLVASNPTGDWLIGLGNVIAYAYVTNWTMFTEFLTVLWSDPSNLMATRSVQEICLFRDTLVAGSSIVLGWVILYLPHHGVALLTTIADHLHWAFMGVTSIIGVAFQSAWSTYIGWIATGITPYGPAIIQPLLNQIFHGVAVTIGTSILIWILRILFGFPF